MKNKEKRSFFSVLFLPGLFFLIMWGVKLVEHVFEISFVSFGVFPQTFSGIKGVFFSPFIHKDFSHLINNSYPIIILGGMLFSFYKIIAHQLFFLLFFLSGFFLWLIGRDCFHIGASGIIYALAAFLLVSGVIRKNPSLSSVSLIVIFLYGSMIWGILPTNNHISWEGHLSGFITGILIAFVYKGRGPKRKKYQWEIDEEIEAFEKNNNSFDNL